MSTAENFKSQPFVFITVSFIIGLINGIKDISIIIPLLIAAFGITLLFAKRDSLFIIGILLCNNERRKYGLLCFIVVCNLLIWKWAFNDKKMNIIFMDVSQGDAQLLFYPMIKQC